MKTLAAAAILAVFLPSFSGTANPEANPIANPDAKPVVNPVAPPGANPGGSAVGSPVGPAEADLDALPKFAGAIRPVYRKPVSKSHILTLYHRLKPGQSREEVEEFLGKPVIGSEIVNGSEQWYINETERKKFVGSPWGMAGICVHFDEDGKLVSAKFNSQYIRDKDLESYLKRHGKMEEKEEATKP